MLSMTAPKAHGWSCVLKIIITGRDPSSARGCAAGNPMELLNIQATGLKAIGLLVVAFVVWVILSGPRFSRMSGDLDEVTKKIPFDITTREMRHLVADMHGKSWVEMKGQLGMEGRTEQLHVIIIELKCADTFVMAA